jgi:beta-galactosidase
MKKYRSLTTWGIFLFIALSPACRRAEVPAEFTEAIKGKGRSEILFDADWKFHRGDTSGAETASFDHSAWRTVNLPHDWSIEDLPGKESAIDSNALGGIDAGYLTGGTGWYRKEFFLPLALKNKHFQLRFDGVYMNSEVWVNGEPVGENPYGYTSFRFDITPNLKPGSVNCIAVKVRNEGRNSRWYSGSGIYRHVWFTVAAPVHLDPWKISVTTVRADSSSAKISIASELLNDSKLPAKAVAAVSVYTPEGKLLSRSESTCEIDAGKTSLTETEFNIVAPSLWSVVHPRLCSASVELFVEDREGRRILVDRIDTPFGIRTVTVSAEEGLKLNGKKILLKGGCMHHDNGPLGGAAFDRAEERRVELMKASGFNAIRCSHNPPSPAFLAACDRLGMLVIDEAFDMWSEPKNPDDYHKWFAGWWRKDVESMVYRDRNHPSVIFWSIGNEIPERAKPEGRKLAADISEYIRKIDPSRLITSAVNGVGPDMDPYFSALDICGYNYEKDKYVPDHKRLPSRVMFGSESFALEAFDYWMAVKDNPWVIGDFVWTGFDYLGEASIGWLGYPHEGSFYPWTAAYCGDIDICGFRRPQSFYREVLWSDSVSLSLFVHPPVPTFPANPKKAEWSKWEWQDVVASWNWKGSEGKTLKVDVYSNSPEVELFLNGRSLGKKKTDRQTKWIASWNVRYEAGILEARSYSKGMTVSAKTLRTAGEPEKIAMKADRGIIKSDNADLSYVTVELTDSSGIPVPVSGKMIKFSITGPGTVEAVGSPDPRGTESFKLPHRKTFQGRCLVIIRSGKQPGEIKLKAESDGCSSSELTVRSI